MSLERIENLLGFLTDDDNRNLAERMLGELNDLDAQEVIFDFLINDESGLKYDVVEKLNENIEQES